MFEFLKLGYWGLFVASLLAGSIIPFNSEIVFSALAFKNYNLWTCVSVATIGNWIGGMSCYYLGKQGKLDWIEKRAGVKRDKIFKFSNMLQRYGGWFSCLSFIPILGNVIIIASGFFKCNVWVVGPAMFFGKLVRYLLWMYLNYLVFY